MARFVSFGILRALLLLCIVSLHASVLRAEDDGGMCTMETKETCAGDTEEEPTEGADRYSEEANTATEDSSNPPPVSTLNDKPPSTAEDESQKTKPKKGTYWEGQEHLHIACVICGDRAPEALVMMKSGVVFSSSPLTYHIFTEDHLQKELSKELTGWQDVKNERVSFKFYPIQYPQSEDGKTWRATFQPCATMRLFIPTTSDIEAAIYLDTDILFLSPVEKLWKHFHQFNSTQLAGVAPESEDLVNSWYPRFARHPFYGKAGVNSGVMLMNMTRIRAVRRGTWEKELIQIYHKYRYNISWGDQCLLNIYFHLHPELLYTFTCDWNFRPDHCMYGVNNCGLSKDKLPKLIHGNRRAFHDKPRQPFFKAVYDKFVKLQINNSLKSKEFVKALNNEFDAVSKKDKCLLARTPLLNAVRQAAKSVASRKERLLKNTRTGK